MIKPCFAAFRVRSYTKLAGVTPLLALAWAGCAPAASGDEAIADGVAQSLAGVDGSLTLPTGTAATLNAYATLVADVPLGATSIAVDSVAALTTSQLGPVAAGDLLLVYQAQGAEIDTSDTPSYGAVANLNGAGAYDLVEVLGVSGDRVSLSCGLSHAYRIAGHTQVVRVPQFQALTIPSGATLQAPAWDGARGGVVAIRTEALVLDGTIDVAGRGYRGGVSDNASSAAGLAVVVYRGADEADGARKGEGIAGSEVEYARLGGAFGRGAPANGGGGGNAHNAGGGAGANAGAQSGWSGQGVMLSTVTGASAWSLDPAAVTNGNQPTRSPGGGRGGYTYSASNQDALTLAPGAAAWGGNQRREGGGLGGHPLPNEPATRVFFGGGGGAGDGNNGVSGAGGPGGGLVILIADGITGSGLIRADGSDGEDATGAGNDAPGGGGGGGSVVIDAPSLATSITIEARGGKGGSQVITTNEAEGPGGGGGGGFVALRAGTPSVAIGGGLSGTSSSAAVSEFPTNGATAGGDGIRSPLLSLPFCADTNAPDTRLTRTPAAVSNDATPKFAFASDDAAAGFECKLDTGSYSTCSSPYAAEALLDGAHSFSVRAKDAIGNVDATPATFDFTVDRTPPQTEIDSAPPSLGAGPNADFAVSSDELPVTFECSVDLSTLAECAAAFSIGPLAAGEHVLSVRAVDAAGNVDPTPATYGWTVIEVLDTDGDGLSDSDEATLGTDSLDEDSDHDGIFDGTETGVGCDNAATDPSLEHCIADADAGATTTDPLAADTDGGGLQDGDEDVNHDGRIERGERDPNDPADDGCSSDGECGGVASGRVCRAESRTCVDGCRGSGGNGCPVDLLCSSTTTVVGSCFDGAGGAGGQGGADGQGGEGLGGQGAAGGPEEPEIDAPRLEGDGCSCSLPRRSHGGYGAFLVATCAGIVARRRSPRPRAK